MTEQPLAALAAIVGLAYLAVLGLAITSTTYDTWGALVVLPPILVIGAWSMRRIFPRDLGPIGTIMIVGLPIKMAGAAARYWVGFEAYAGGIDAARYHNFASARASAVWTGEMNPFRLVPTSRGTPFMEEVTAVVYTVTGSSLLGGFFVFAFIAYIGTAFFVKAACVAVPGLLQRRYAVLCILAPSIVYWPASIGKEAWMFLTLGIASYGIARLLTRQGFVVPLVVAVAALLAAAMLRPHLAALWVAGAVPASMIAVFVRREGDGARRGVDVAIASVMVVLAGGGLILATGAAIRYLDFADEGDTGFDTVTAIVDETTRRTVQAGSNFDTIEISNPRNWPFASVRTLTRPTIIEARGAGQLLSALEMTVLIGISAVSWRRFANLPRLMLRVPYVTYAMAVLFAGSLAFTSFGNLGILTRQRTLLFPFLLLLLALPTRREQQTASEQSSRDSQATGEVLTDAERDLDLVGAGRSLTPVGWVTTAVRADAGSTATQGSTWVARTAVGSVPRTGGDAAAGAWQPSTLAAAGHEGHNGSGGDPGAGPLGARAAGEWTASRPRPDRDRQPIAWHRATPRDASSDGSVTAAYADDDTTELPRPPTEWTPSRRRPPGGNGSSAWHGSDPEQG